jgi:hypothetical protein
MPDAAPTCESCIEQKSACDHARACASNADCDAFWRCYLACQTPDCQWACVPEHDAGAALFRPLYADFSGTCAAPCGYGSYWACAGHVAWPIAPRTVTWTYLVRDYFTGKGVGGASVNVCTGCPCDAVHPVLGAGQTDQDGYVTLTFTQPLMGSGQAIPVCAVYSAPGYRTTIAYAGSPYVTPIVSVQNSLLQSNYWAGDISPPPVASQVVSSYTGVTPDPALGVGVGAVFDCLSSPALGVTVSIDAPDAGAWPPSDSGVEGGVAAQTSSGQPIAGGALFFNVPPGNYTMTATVPGVGRVSQVAVAFESLEAGVGIQVGMPPTP